MTSNQRAAIVDFVLHRIDERQFLDRFGVAKEDIPARAAAALADAIRHEDADSLEHAHLLHLAFELRLELPVIHQLVAGDWHHQHEDLIRELQDAKDPRSVPALREAIRLKPRLEYLDYDDYGAYYKKCLWALQAIGTPEAVELVRECAKSEIPELQEQARHRLARMGV